MTVLTTAAGKRLVYSATGPLDRDEDDVRRVSEAAEAGVKRLETRKIDLLVDLKTGGKSLLDQ